MPRHCLTLDLKDDADSHCGVQTVSRKDMAGGEAEPVRRGSGRDGDLSAGDEDVHDHGCG